MFGGLWQLLLLLGLAVGCFGLIVVFVVGSGRWGVAVVVWRNIFGDVL